MLVQARRIEDRVAQEHVSELACALLWREWKFPGIVISRDSIPNLENFPRLCGLNGMSRIEMKKCACLAQTAFL